MCMCFRVCERSTKKKDATYPSKNENLGWMKELADVNLYIDGQFRQQRSIHSQIL